MDSSSRPWVAMLVAVAAVRAAAGETMLSSEVRATLILRTLGFNRTFEARREPVVTIVIVVPAKDRNSVIEQTELVGTLASLEREGAKAGTKRVRPVALTLNPSLPFADQLRTLDPAAAYLCSGFDEPQRQAIRKAARQEKVLTLSGTEQYRTAGFSVLLNYKADKANVVINLKAAREEGADLDSRMLRLVEVDDVEAKQ